LENSADKFFKERTNGAIILLSDSGAFNKIKNLYGSLVLQF
jgi:hypothetical protein